MDSSFTSTKGIELVYRLRELSSAGTILHIGAHPDDEDAGLMAYTAHKLGLKIVYWSATRGEGGQNKLGSETQEALGIYRTWESQAVRAIDGGNILFGPFYDFGYSKSGAETLGKWGGREIVTREVVRAIRIVQPMIVISRWTGNLEVDGHGHHQAIGSVIKDAFRGSGDPSQFRELQAQSLPAWQAQRLFFSTGGDWQPGEEGGIFGAIRAELETDAHVRINTGELDPLTETTYQEQAWIGFNNHKTQAMGFVPQKEPFYYYYSRSESLVPETSERNSGFFDGLDPSLTGLSDYSDGLPAESRKYLVEIQSIAGDALAAFQANDTTRAARLLLGGAGLLKKLHDMLVARPTDGVYLEALMTALRRKRSDFEIAAVRCLGIQLECVSNHARLTPGQQFSIDARLWNLREIPILINGFSVIAPEDWVVESDEITNSRAKCSQQNRCLVTVSKMADLACPYWLKTPRDRHFYHWPPGDFVARAFNPPVVTVDCDITFENYQFTIQSEVVLREASPAGFRELPIAVVPPISLHPRTQIICLQTSPSEKVLELQVVAQSNVESSGVNGLLKLITPARWDVNPSEVNLDLGVSGDSRLIKFQVTLPGNLKAGIYPVHYSVNCGGRDYDVVLKPVRMGAPGLPRLPDASTCIREQFISVPAVNQINLINAKFEHGLKYGYIKGIAEDVLSALSHFDLDFHIIDDDELAFIDLLQFDAIIIGPNAYLIREELRKNAFRFPDYVFRGGTLIVQYQGYGFQKDEFVPYPFKYNQPHDRVTDESSPVTILDSEHFIFWQPNRISDDDFKHWVHDRGMYFFGEWDSRYTPLLCCNDPGETPKKGGMLLSSYGRGSYVYCAYSFFRQLPEGVPGAFRLFANLLAIPRAVILARSEILKSVSLFSGLDKNQLKLVASLMTERWDKNGEYICLQDAEGDEMYIVISGEVEIIKKAPGKQEAIIHKAVAGNAIGEFQVLMKSKRSASMRAKGDVHLLVIEGVQFRELMHQYPVISDKMIQVLVEKLVASGST